MGGSALITEGNGLCLAVQGEGLPVGAADIGVRDGLGLALLLGGGGLVLGTLGSAGAVRGLLPFDVVVVVGEVARH